MKLVSIITDKYNFHSKQHSIYTIWKLLCITAVKYFYDIFNKDFGSLFKNIDNKSLEECIDIYTTIDVINIKAKINVSLLIYYFMYTGIISNNNFKDNVDNVITILIKKIENLEQKQFERVLIERPKVNKLTIDNIDLMNGFEFEQVVANIFSKLGYQTSVTKKTGDQGIDIIAEKNGVKIGIQAKNYSSAVSNSAIQEVVAGLKHYQCNKGIVVTNNFFTNSASSLAESNGIVLWDRNILKEKISLLND